MRKEDRKQWCFLRRIDFNPSVIGASEPANPLYTHTSHPPPPHPNFSIFGKTTPRPSRWIRFSTKTPSHGDRESVRDRERKREREYALAFVRSCGLHPRWDAVFVRIAIETRASLCNMKMMCAASRSRSNLLLALLLLSASVVRGFVAAPTRISTRSISRASIIAVPRAAGADPADKDR